MLIGMVEFVIAVVVSVVVCSIAWSVGTMVVVRHIARAAEQYLERLRGV